MRRYASWLGLALVLFLGIGFAASNAGRVVTIDLGVITLFRVPITFVAFGGMVVGMSVVLLAGINADLKVRRLLERHALGQSLAGREWEDQARGGEDPDAVASGPGNASHALGDIGPEPASLTQGTGPRGRLGEARPQERGRFSDVPPQEELPIE